MRVWINPPAPCQTPSRKMKNPGHDSGVFKNTLLTTLLTHANNNLKNGLNHDVQLLKI